MRTLSCKHKILENWGKLVIFEALFKRENFTAWTKLCAKTVTKAADYTSY